jgi:hypothetical protein
MQERLPHTRQEAPYGARTDAVQIPRSSWKMPGTNGLSLGALAISGDIALVGDRSFGDINAAYVFVQPASGWVNMTETAKLFPRGCYLD